MPSPRMLFLLLVMSFLLVAAGLADRRHAPVVSGEAGYFQSHVAGEAHLSDLALQAKAIAAARHVSPAEIRLLLDQRVMGRDRAAHADVADLNRALDERWPIK